MAEPEETRRLTFSEDRMMRILADFKLDLFRELEKRFRDVVRTAELAALELRTGNALDSLNRRYGDLERRTQTLEQNDAAGGALATFLRWAVPIAIGTAIALAQHLRGG